MFAAMLFAISIVALSQFGIYYWRAVLAAAAGQPVSDGILAAAGVANGRVTAGGFGTLADLHELTPNLNPNQGGLSLVRLYYRAVDGVSALLGRHMPSVASWCDQEL